MKHLCENITISLKYISQLLYSRLEDPSVSEPHSVSLQKATSCHGRRQSDQYLRLCGSEQVLMS